MIMLLITTTALNMPSAAPAEESDAEHVVVVAKKLEATQGSITTNVLTGKSRCTVSKTSGDARIDKAVCDIAIGCLKARKDGATFKPCVVEGRKRFLASLETAQEGSEN